MISYENKSHLFWWRVFFTSLFFILKLCIVVNVFHPTAKFEEILKFKLPSISIFSRSMSHLIKLCTSLINLKSQIVKKTQIHLVTSIDLARWTVSIVEFLGKTVWSNDVCLLSMSPVLLRVALSDSQVWCNSNSSR